MMGLPTRTVKWAICAANAANPLSSMGAVFPHPSMAAMVAETGKIQRLPWGKFGCGRRMFGLEVGRFCQVSKCSKHEFITSKNLRKDKIHLKLVYLISTSNFQNKPKQNKPPPYIQWPQSSSQPCRPTLQIEPRTEKPQSWRAFSRLSKLPTECCAYWCSG
jgi:hypothetical protein